MGQPVRADDPLTVIWEPQAVKIASEAVRPLQNQIRQIFASPDIRLFQQPQPLTVI